MTNKHRILIVISILVFSTGMAFLFFRPVKVSYNQSGAAGNLPVVPGAPLGPGMDTRAAYGCGQNPIVIRVNRLDDPIPAPGLSAVGDGTFSGTLRAALNDGRPRVVVFEKSGYIQLQDWIGIDNPCLTVAGQTAPSPGITIKGGGDGGSIEIHTRDILIQHVRFRGGDDYCSSGPASWYVDGSTTGIVWDHVSNAWNFDEGINLGGGTGGNQGTLTVWRSITGEGLGNSTLCGADYIGYLSHGFLIYHHVNALIAQSLTAENHMRNPGVHGGGSNLAFLNNVVSSAQSPVLHATSQVSGNNSDEPWNITHVGNVVIAGPESCCDFYNPTLNLYNYDIDQGYAPNNAIYRNDNILINPYGFGVTTEINELDYNPNVGTPPSQAPIPSNYNMLPASATESFVLANAGARPMDRDAVDNQIISRVRNREGDISRSTVAAYGGWPTMAQNTRAFTLPANPHTYTASGYTNLELALHNAAALVEGTGGTNPPPGPPPPPSPNGTKVPPASSISDNSGNTWTIGGGNTILRNGVQAGAGVGTVLLWYQNNIYTLSTDNNWWQWNGTSWTNIGPNDPSVQAVSADGTEVPTVSQITDNNQDVWTISGNTILRNGVQAGGGVGTILLWSNVGKIYTLSTDNAWWLWNGTNWTQLGYSKPNMGDLNKDHIINSLDWSYMNSKDFSAMNANWFMTW
jgi:hypothetical protein